MEKTLFALSLGIAGAVIAAQSVHASPQCGPRDQVVQALATKYGETRRSVGMSGPDQMMELFAADETRTWTILVSRPDGSSCLVASGSNFEAVTEQLPARGDPA
jgi:hypothetical protein